MEQCENKKMCKGKCNFPERVGQKQKTCDRCGKPVHCWDYICNACQQAEDALDGLD